jgi:hypothetical protein
VATNLSQVDFPAQVFGDLYHQRWRIEESYKRLKHRAKIESVSGLTQHAVLIDLYSKVLGDNLNALVCMGAIDDADLAPSNRRCNRAYAGACLQRILPRLVISLECLAALLEKAFGLLGANSHKRRRRSDPIVKPSEWFTGEAKLPATYDILRINAMPPGRDLTTCRTSSPLLGSSRCSHDLKRNSYPLEIGETVSSYLEIYNELSGTRSCSYKAVSC